MAGGAHDEALQDASVLRFLDSLHGGVRLLNFENFEMLFLLHHLSLSLPGNGEVGLLSFEVRFEMRFLLLPLLLDRALLPFPIFRRCDAELPEVLERLIQGELDDRSCALHIESVSARCNAGKLNAPR